ncbi:MAG: cyanophycinase [Burkholderiales bacterium]|nr:cyanophycinase [Opitutaceae bacterium]
MQRLPRPHPSVRRLPTRFLPFLLGLLALLATLALAPRALAQRPVKPSGLTSYFSGDPVDAPVLPVGGPALLLMGGGSEVDLAFVTRAYPILAGGDIVVLRASGSSGYQSYFFTDIPGQLPVADRTRLKPNSVETLVVNSRAKANLDYVRYALDHAELIWMAGGDQNDYTTYWRGTAVETALRAAYARGAVLGGTSAGAMVLGEYLYDPAVSAVTSAEAVANPYRSSVTLSTDFLRLPLLYDTLVDVHFANRDRMGRLLTFMARLRQDARTSAITGLGIDENTALFVNSLGLATFLVDGNGSGRAYVLREDRLDTIRPQVAPNLPLLYQSVRRTKLAPGQTFDFPTGVTTGVTTLLTVNGTAPASPY